MDILDVKQAYQLSELRKSIKEVQTAFGADPTQSSAKIVVTGNSGGVQDGLRAVMELEGNRMNRLANFLSDLLTNVETRLTALGVTWTP